MRVEGLVPGGGWVQVHWTPKSRVRPLNPKP